MSWLREQRCMSLRLQCVHRQTLESTGTESPPPCGARSRPPGEGVCHPDRPAIAGTAVVLCYTGSGHCLRGHLHMRTKVAYEIYYRCNMPAH